MITNIQKFNNKPIPKRKDVAHQGKMDKNNYTNRPAQAISFGGSIASTTQKMTQSFVNNKTLNKIIDAANNNEAAYVAINSLFVAGLLKPLFVLNMPGSDDKDKQMVATKNFLNAFLGSFINLTIIGKFHKESVDIVKNNLNMIDGFDDKNKIKTIKADSDKALEMANDALIKENTNLSARFKNAKNTMSSKEGFNKVTSFLTTFIKKPTYKPSIDERLKKSKDMIAHFTEVHKGLLEKRPEFVKKLINGSACSKSQTTYKDAFLTFWKNSPGSLTAIGKAKISSIFLPSVMALMFAKRNLENERKELAKQTTLNTNQQFKKEQAQFQAFLDNKNNSDNKNVSFKGGTHSVVDKGATFIEKTMAEPVVKLLANAKKPAARMQDLESILLTLYWIVNTTRSKKIEPSQKLGFNIHSALVTIVSSISAFILDGALDGLIDKAKTEYSEKLTGVVDGIKKQGLNIKDPSAAIKGYSASVQSALKEKCTELIEQAAKAGETEVSNGAIKKALDDLKHTETIKSAIENKIIKTEDISEAKLKNLIKSFQSTLPIEDAIKKGTANLSGSKKIAKALSKIDLNSTTAVEKEIKKLTSAYGKRLSKFKSLTIFTLVVRFLVPVLMVPFSGKLKKKIVEMTNQKKAQENNTQKA